MLSLGGLKFGIISIVGNFGTGFVDHSISLVYWCAIIFLVLATPGVTGHVKEYSSYLICDGPANVISYSTEGYDVYCAI